ncbi:transglycosylase SLT domain-containing protein [Thiosocius teredinicola]|uniref:transglycosylase SLT domain-containing protein n=1 Tax=Thiosocius teredinicola TaxID=1973002 RepID=UPI0009910B76
MVLQRPVSALVLAFVCVFAGAATAASLAEQRELFLAAEQALARNDHHTFAKLEKQLRDYPLHPYLEYRLLREKLSKAKAGDVSRFLKKHEGTRLSRLLRMLWLNELGKQKRWNEYLAFYESSSANENRECYYANALIATGNTKAGFAGVPALWLYGKSRPESCDPVFNAWTKAGKRTHDMTWQRIKLAMDAGQWRLAEYLGKSLPKSDQVWVQRWSKLYQQPRTVTKVTFSEKHPYREAMFPAAIRRLARWDGPEAMHAWETLKARYDFTPEQVRETEQYIVRNLVRVPGDEAYEFIHSVDVGKQDLPAHEARIRSALLREDWPQVIEWIAALPQDERNQEGWLYWLARALEGKGDNDVAHALYQRVAKERSYYGFLAADRIGVAYHLFHADTPASPQLLKMIEAMPGVKRARELFALERWSDARAEWQIATKDLDSDQLKAAAKLAKVNGWHDRAIFTLARTDYWDDLELRFPLEHTGLVDQNAARQGIDKAWIYAVMRQESAFMSNARSPVGAMGLMQLMPATARTVSRKILNRTPPSRYELLQPDTNIELGSAYLKHVKSELGDSAMLATAAYNAGPHRVNRWLPQRTLPADIWIELVPFSETRGYLRRVLAYTVIYESRMGKNPTRLNDRLHPVPPSLNRLGSSQTAKRNGDSAG